MTEDIKSNDGPTEPKIQKIDNSESSDKSNKNSMEATITYENCPVAFFTTQTYTNAPYTITGRVTENHVETKNLISKKSWYTYRHSFEPITDSVLTSDAGWGCAVRVGQMLLAEAISRLEPQGSMSVHRLHFFDTNDSAFSLHSLVKNFAKSDKSKIGTWLGPNDVSHSLKNCLNESEMKEKMNIFVAMDSTIAVPDLPQIEKPLLLLLPLRLGLETINVDQYEKPLLETFTFPQTVGIIGGRPRLAFYLFGHSFEKEILALDPHTVRPTNLHPNESEFTCDSPLIIPSLSKLDPSMALGFLVKSSFDLEDLLVRLEKTKLCAVMRETKFDFDGDFDCKMPDTDDEFEILGAEK